MNKITLLFAYLLCAFQTQAQVEFPNPYCGPAVIEFGIEPITLVNFAGINQATPVFSSEEHVDYTAVTAQVEVGGSHPIILKGFTDGDYENYLAVYIDWNQDYDFDDESETYLVGIIENSDGTDVTLQGTIDVPAFAVPGATRMRVAKSYDGYPDACFTEVYFGQAQDFTVNVTVPQCVAPTAGAAVVISGTSVELSWTSTTTTNFVLVQLAGAGTPSTADGTGIEVTNSTFTASSLTAMTNYEFYVRTICSGDIYSSWSGPYPFNTTLLPGCVSNPSPANGATNVPVGPITLTWNAPSSGDPVISYDLYSGTTPTNVTTLLGNYTATTTANDLEVNAYGTTVYWRIAPKNAAGVNNSCEVFSFTTELSPGYCLAAQYGQYPLQAFTPSNCDGVTPSNITTIGYAGEFSMVNVTSGQTYIFRSSVATDFITIGNETGVTSLSAETTPLTWVADFTGQVRFYTHADNQCAASATSRTRSVICGVPTSQTPDFANLDGPATITIPEGDVQMVSGRVLVQGLTDVAPNIEGQAPGITAWIGYSTSNTNPNTWTNWIPATHNATFVNNQDEYRSTIGGTLSAGTYYYATRFRLDNGPFVYGGYNSGFWNGTTNVSGILTITPPPAPENDDCIDAIELIVNEDFCDGTNTNASNLGATASNIDQASCFDDGTLDVWFSFVAPEGMTAVTISTDFTGGTLTDSQIALYSGNCGNLVEIDCDQDGGETTLSNGFAWNSVIADASVTENETYYVRVSGYSDDDVGSFCVKVSGQVLSAPEFNNAKISAYPNPVKSVLTIENSSTISAAAVYNLLGQVVVEKQINNTSAQLDLSRLASGTYIVKITSDQQTKTIKIIKE